MAQMSINALGKKPKFKFGKPRLKSKKLLLKEKKAKAPVDPFKFNAVSELNKLNEELARYNQFLPENMPVGRTKTGKRRKRRKKRRRNRNGRARPRSGTNGRKTGETSKCTWTRRR